MKKQVVRELLSSDSSSSDDSRSSSDDDRKKNGTSSDTDSSSSSSSASDKSEGKVAEMKVYIPRRVYSKRNFCQSTWYLHFLATDALKQTLRSDHTHRDTKEFKGMFRVSFTIFEDLVSTVVEEGWYDPNKRDATGHLCSNVDLLVLGVLFRLGNGSCTRWAIQSSTNIDKEVHRKFFKMFTEKMSSIRERYISFPKDEASLRQVSRQYASLGLPGCCGSIDVVHIGWDACPANLLHLFKGKESYPSIAYEVIVNQRREIMSVTDGHPGARNDKHICRLDPELTALSNSSHWLANKEWWAFGDNDTTVVEI